MTVSIVILTFNGLQDHFKETVEAVLAQKTKRSVEIIVIDSGSTDGTVDYVRKLAIQYPNLKLSEIPPSEFGHGKTRQFGSTLAMGEVIVYLTQDAIPADGVWLESLVEVFEEDQSVMAAASRVLPRSEAIPLRKYHALREWYAQDQNAILSADEAALADFRSLQPRLKLHDISAAYRKEFLDRFRFDDVPFGEDVLIAKKILMNHYAIAFASRSLVYHSHDYAIKKIFYRNIEDGHFHKKYLNRSTVDSIMKLIHATLLPCYLDVRMLLKDQGVTTLQKSINMVYSPVIHFTEALGQYIGQKKA